MRRRWDEPFSSLRGAEGDAAIQTGLLRFARNDGEENMTCPRLFDLSGKVAIVTGSSRGIGLAIAAALAEHGAKVVISSRKQDACDEVAHAINAQHGDQRAVA